MTVISFGCSHLSIKIQNKIMTNKYNPVFSRKKLMTLKLWPCLILELLNDHLNASSKDLDIVFVSEKAEKHICN